MRFVPGPDLPGGGQIVGLDGIREAYLTGRGQLPHPRHRPDREGHPAPQGHRRHRAALPGRPREGHREDQEPRPGQEAAGHRRRQGPHRPQARPAPGHRGQERLQPRGRARAALPADPDGGLLRHQQRRPRRRPAAHAGAEGAAAIYVDFRIDVVRRRTAYRLRKREDRLHLVEGLLVAILDIDEVIQLIRGSDDTARPGPGSSRSSTCPRCRPTTSSTCRCAGSPSSPGSSSRPSATSCSARSRSSRRSSTTRSCCAARCPTSWPTWPRRTARRGAPCCWSPPAPRAAVATPLEVADDPCWVLLSSTGLLARTSTADPLPSEGGRAKHDVIVGAVRTTARGEVALVTSRGRMVRLSALELPTLPPLGGAPDPVRRRAAGALRRPGGGRGAAGARAARRRRRRAWRSAPPQGVVKRVTTDYPGRLDWEVVALKDGDQRRRRRRAARRRRDLVFVTSDAQLLHFPASAVRPQGRAAGGMAGVKLAAGASVVFFGVVDPAADAVVVTSAGSSGALPGTEAGALKVTPYAEYPAKGRATGGVRATGSSRARTPSCSPGSGGAGPGAAAQRRRRSSCPTPPAARRLGHAGRRSSPGSARRCADASSDHRTGAPNGRVTQSLPAGGAGPLRCVCKRFYLCPGSLIAEADNPSRRNQEMEAGNGPELKASRCGVVRPRPSCFSARISAVPGSLHATGQMITRRRG